MRAVFLGLILATSRLCVAGGGPAETVVLVNTASADSKRVAAHYAARRDVPARQVCEVSCTGGLETSIEDFVRDVVDPLRTFLRERGIEDRCRFVVMTQGMPIRATTGGGGHVSTAAALALLDTSVCGMPQGRIPTLRNPYTAGPAPADRVVEGGRLLLVTALISTTADEAMALVDRSVAADGTAPADARFVFQDASSPASGRNGSYDAARRELESHGFATEHDDAGTRVVVGRKRVMGYLSGGSYSDLTVDGVDGNEYLPGALCDMLQSFGAAPSNFEPNGHRRQFPVTNMVRAGITGVHGTVSEPYSIAFPTADLFGPYVEGYTLAETFQQRSPYLYWMNLTLGDPLCAPYAKRPKPTLTAKRDPARGFVLDVAAPGAVRIDVYVDGIAIGKVDADAGSVTLEPPSWPCRGPHVALVEAVGPGPAEPRGWIAKPLAWTEPGPRADAHGAAQAARLDVPATASVTAGEVLSLPVRAVRADGSALPAFAARIEARTDSPPVRWCYADAATTPFDMPLRLTRAGDYDLRLTALPGGPDAKCKVHVDPGAFHHATTAAETYPLGQADDLEVLLEDAYGNRVTKWSGTIELRLPSEAGRPQPEPVRVTESAGGRVFVRNLLFSRAGVVALTFVDGSGRRVSAEGEHVRVVKAPLRAWKVATPLPVREALFAGDPAANPGDAEVRRLLAPRVDHGDQVALLPSEPKETKAGVAVTWIEAAKPTKVRLLAAASFRIKVFVDGKAVFDGTPDVVDARAGKRDPIATLPLAAGTHRVTVVGAAKGLAEFCLELDDGAGRFPPDVTVRRE